jgi:cytochrome c peroxidase
VPALIVGSQLRLLASWSAKAQEYVFKVPTLRDITLTASYFHTGRVWNPSQAVAIIGQAKTEPR